MAALAHLAVLIFPGLRVLFPGGEPGLEAADGTEPDDHDDARGAVARRELALHRVWRLSGTAAHPAPDGRGKVGGPATVDPQNCDVRSLAGRVGDLSGLGVRDGLCASGQDVHVAGRSQLR